MNWLDAAPFLERLFFGLGAGAVTWLACLSFGRLVTRALRIETGSDGAIAAATGYALLGTLVGALSLGRAIAWQTLAALVSAGVLLFVFDRLRNRGASPQNPLASLEGLPALDVAAVAVTAFAWITAAIAAALPASWWDPIAYHLPIVADALFRHAFSVHAIMVQTAFPLLGEAAALPAYALAGSAGAAMATLGAGIALALVCGDWADRIAPGSGRLTVALVSCSALWLWLAPSFYVDVPFALFAVAALSLAARIAQAGAGAPIGIATGAGLLAGAAAATKYPGLITLAIGIAIAVVSAPRDRRAGSFAGFVLAAAVIGGGGYLRSAWLMPTHDPLYPFLSTHAPGAIGAFAQRYVQMTRSWCGGGTSLFDFVALPWRLLTDPRSFCGDPGYALDLAVIFFLVSLAAFRRVGTVLMACAALTVGWFVGSQQLRFLMPAVCLFAIAAAAGTQVLRGGVLHSPSLGALRSPRIASIAQGALILLCGVGVLVNWLPGPTRDASNSIAPAYAYIVARESGDDYLSGRLEFYDAVRWLRVHREEPGSIIGCLNDVRDYYFGPGAVWLNPYYQEQNAVDWSAPPQDRARALMRMGGPYIVVNANEAYVHRTPTGVDWSVLARDVASGYLRPLFSAHDVTVYEVTVKP